MAVDIETVLEVLLPQIKKVLAKYKDIYMVPSIHGITFVNCDKKLANMMPIEDVMRFWEDKYEIGLAREVKRYCELLKAQTHEQVKEDKEVRRARLERMYGMQNISELYKILADFTLRIEELEGK